jgi:predicted nucleic acid-binding protein
MSKTGLLSLTIRLAAEEHSERVAEWREADEHLVAAALKEAGAVPLTAVDAIHVAAAKSLKCDEFITAEKPGKPLHMARGLKVSFLPTV